MCIDHIYEMHFPSVPVKCAVFQNAFKRCSEGGVDMGNPRDRKLKACGASSECEGDQKLRENAKNDKSRFF